MACVLLAGCGGGEPKAEDRTLDYILSHGKLRIGVVEKPPWTRQGMMRAGGVEGALVRSFAHSMNARPKWYYLSESEALAHLQARRLDIVIGGLTTHSPETDVTFTTPFITLPGDREHVMATQLGENRFRVALERFLDARKAETEARFLKEAAR